MEEPQLQQSASRPKQSGYGEMSKPIWQAKEAPRHRRVRSHLSPIHLTRNKEEPEARQVRRSLEELEGQVRSGPRGKMPQGRAQLKFGKSVEID